MLLLTKEDFKKLIKNAINCVERGLEKRYRLKDGTIVVNYGGMCFVETEEN